MSEIGGESPHLDGSNRTATLSRRDRTGVPVDPPMALKTAFLTTSGVNPGDDFIRAGVRFILDAAGCPHVPLLINKHDPLSVCTPNDEDGVTVDEKFWESDFVVQAGAPVFWYLMGGQATSALAEWREWLWRDRVLHPSATMPFVMLGVGSAFTTADEESAFSRDANCASLARGLVERSSLTTVRDATSLRLLKAMGLTAHLLPCPAFFAASRHPITHASADDIAVNIMPDAGHPHSADEGGPARWRRELPELLVALRRIAPLRFVAHHEDEARFMTTLARPEEPIHRGRSWKETLQAYAGCSLLVANRVHAVVAAAGYDVPGIVLGTDSRIETVAQLGLPAFSAFSGDVPRWIETIKELYANRAAHARRLASVRLTTLDAYVNLLAPLCASWKPHVAEDASRDPVFAFHDGWHAPEWQGDDCWRWVADGGSLTVHAFAPGWYCLRGEALCAVVDDAVHVRAGEQEITFTAPHDRFAAVPALALWLDRGDTILHVRTAGPPVTTPPDLRLRSVAWRNLSIATCEAPSPADSETRAVTGGCRAT